MPPTEQQDRRALGWWLVRVGVIVLVVTAFVQAVLPELGYLLFKSRPSGSYTSSEFAWENAWLAYAVGAANVIAGIFVARERSS